MEEEIDDIWNESAEQRATIRYHRSSSSRRAGPSAGRAPAKSTHQIERDRCRGVLVGRHALRNLLDVVTMYSEKIVAPPTQGRCIALAPVSDATRPPRMRTHSAEPRDAPR